MTSVTQTPAPSLVPVSFLLRDVFDGDFRFQCPPTVAAIVQEIQSIDLFGRVADMTAWALADGVLRHPERPAHYGEFLTLERDG